MYGLRVRGYVVDDPRSVLGGQTCLGRSRAEEMMSMARDRARRRRRRWWLWGLAVRRRRRRSRLYGSLIAEEVVSARNTTTTAATAYAPRRAQQTHHVSFTWAVPRRRYIPTLRGASSPNTPGYIGERKIKY